MNQKIKETLVSYKSLLQRNLFIIILINCINSFGSAMINAVQSKVAVSVGVDLALIGIMATVYSGVGMVCRLPLGSLCDRANIKKILIAAFAIRVMTSIQFAFVGGTVSYIIMRITTAMVWALIGVAIPTVLGVAMDKKALGGAYSLYLGVWSLTHNYARPAGLALFKAYGGKTVGFVAAGLYIVAIILVLFMDYGRIEEALAKSRQEKLLASAGTQKKKGILPSAILVKALPFCIMIAIPMFLYQADMLYTPILAEERGLTIERALMIGGTLAAVMGIASGVMCDFLGSALTGVVFYLARGIGGILIGLAASQGMMELAIILYCFGENYDAPMTLLCMKQYNKDEIGRFNGTLYFTLDLVGLLSGAIVGVLVKCGYSVTYAVTGGLIVLAAVLVPFVLKLEKGKN